jgi:iron complex outermembrane recepter protein
MQRGISVWDALGTNKAAQMFVNGKIFTDAIVHHVLAGIDMSMRDYYADWNQGAALGDANFNIYKPEYGNVAASEIPQWDRTQDIRERGVRYNNGYNAVYFQDEIGMFQNRLRLTVAGRYTSNKYINPYSGTSSDSKFTPRLGASYSITRNSNAYVVYDQAFLANPGTDWQGKNFDPVTGNNMEVGYKKDWMNHKWNSVISAYRITKNNILTADLAHPIFAKDENGNQVETGQFYNKQTGQQQIQGIELDIKGEIVDNLGVVLNYAYTDATITKDSDPEIIGNNVAGATKHIHNLWLNYSMPKKILDGLRFSIGYQYQSGRSSWFVFDNSENSLPDYFRLDAAVGYSSKDFSVNVNVNNVLNEYLYSGAPYGGLFYWQTEPGRNVRMTVGYKF